ncbi:MAG: hypothetical protein EXR70_14335 [Deltaproteobacteria bacterium]|nr:hypothetical protein [Deltaproteobacteria bacterium]
MAVRKSPKKAPSVGQRLESIEGLARTGFRQVDQRFEKIDQQFDQVNQHVAGVDQRLDFEVGEFKRQIAAQGLVLGQRIDQLANHVDGFMKLHETLDIEF